MFSESSLTALSRQFTIGSIGIASESLRSHLGEICLGGVVFIHKMYLPLHLLKGLLQILSLRSSVAQAQEQDVWPYS